MRLLLLNVRLVHIATLRLPGHRLVGLGRRWCFIIVVWFVLWLSLFGHHHHRWRLFHRHHTFASRRRGREAGSHLQSSQSVSQSISRNGNQSVVNQQVWQSVSCQSAGCAPTHPAILDGCARIPDTRADIAKQTARPSECIRRWQASSRAGRHHSLLQTRQSRWRHQVIHYSGPGRAEQRRVTTTTDGFLGCWRFAGCNVNRLDYF